MIGPCRKSPGWHRHSSRRRTFRKVLLAVYWLADAKGLICTATNAQIAGEAGVGVDAAKGYVGVMERDGVIAVYREEGLPYRVLVILDHPEADALIGRAEKARRTKDRRAREDRIYRAFYDHIAASRA